MSGLNKVLLIGRLTRDPEIKNVNGLSICNFSIATSKEWKDEGGEKHEKTEFHSLVAFKKTADLVSKYLTKGRQTYIEGELQTRSWEAEGVKKYRTEIVVNSVQFLGDGKPKTDGAAVAEQTEIPTDTGQDADIPF